MNENKIIIKGRAEDGRSEFAFKHPVSIFEYNVIMSCLFDLIKKEKPILAKNEDIVELSFNSTLLVREGGNPYYRITFAETEVTPSELSAIQNVFWEGTI